MIVYKVTNLINGKIYIGKTVKTLEGRKKDHLKRSKKRSMKFFSIRTMAAFKAKDNDKKLIREIIKKSRINIFEQ